MPHFGTWPQIRRFHLSLSLSSVCKMGMLRLLPLGIVKEYDARKGLASVWDTWLDIHQLTNRIGFYSEAEVLTLQRL